LLGVGELRRRRRIDERREQADARAEQWRGDATSLTGVSSADARDILWNAFDARFRAEMRRMERSLLLNQLDSAWKMLWACDTRSNGEWMVPSRTSSASRPLSASSPHRRGWLMR
jgi:hypothetical protein